MWALYPTKYNYNEAVYASNFFYNAQRVGTLPLDNSVPWRSNALTYETGALGQQQARIASVHSLPYTHEACATASRVAATYLLLQ